MNALVSKVASVALVATAAVFAIPLSSFAMQSMPGPKHTIAYVGKPDYMVTSEMVAAGGGPKHFSGLKLVAYLSGGSKLAEVGRLTKEFGLGKTLHYASVFTYAVDDGMRLDEKAGAVLPQPQPISRRKLVQALYRAGTNSVGVYDVGFMLDHLLGHPVHDQVMFDIDHRHGDGPPVDYQFHVFLTQAILDLKAQYGV